MHCSPFYSQLKAVREPNTHQSGVDELVIGSPQDGLLCSHLKELDRSVCPTWEEFQH